MIPEKLTDWSYEIVENMLTKGLFESELFDYKELLPDKSKQSEKLRLQKLCCAFANSIGGFIVFGVKDDKSLIAKDRIVGLDSSTDFPEHFGNYPKNCIPTIYWDFLNPPIILNDSKVLHVVQIPKSIGAPHAVGDNEKGWKFPKRTNKGTEGMSIEEVRHSFLGFYEKRFKLQLLLSELESIKDNANSWLITDEKDIEKTYSLVTFESRIIEAVISDSYTILAKHEKLLTELSEMRNQTRVANNKINIFFSIVGVPLTNKKALVKEHNQFMHTKSEVIISLCDSALKKLKELLEQ